MNYEKIAVIADLHGRDELLRRVVEHYPENVGLISVGDMFDSPIAVSGIKGCLDTYQDVGDRMQMILANHEWVPLGAMFAKPEYHDEWVKQWRKLENNTLRSYGLRRRRALRNPSLFKTALEKAGHLDLLLKAPLYVETNEFIVVHAGLSRALSWKTQRRMLDELKEAMLQGEMNPEEFPLQLSSHVYGSDTRTPAGTDKIVVSGHTSTTEPLKMRTSSEGQRVRLASKIGRQAQPLLVWQSWNQRIREFPQDTKKGRNKRRR